MVAPNPPLDLSASLAAWSTGQRLFSLHALGEHGPLSADVVVEQVCLTERLNAPFCLDVQVLWPHGPPPPASLTQAAVALHTLAHGGEQGLHRLSGHVMSVLTLGQSGSVCRQRWRIQPWIARLQQHRHWRIWQNLSTLDVLDAVWSAHVGREAWCLSDGVHEHIAQGRFAARQGRRAQCAQQGESDFDWVQRLLHEEGLGWRVEEHDQAPGGHRVCVFVHAHIPATAPPADDANVSPGQNWAQAEAQGVTQGLSGVCNVRGLRAGTWLKSQGHAWWVTHVQVAGCTHGPPELRAHLAQAFGEPTPMADEHAHLHADTLWAQAHRLGLACHMEAVSPDAVGADVGPADRPHPPPRALQTATVVGPQGQNQPQGQHVIHSDAHGRVRVRFHWQDPHTSEHTAWLPVLQGLAGADTDHVFTPRIGQEVLVGFLAHDLDQAVVLTCLPSADPPWHAHPHSPLGSQTGVRSQEWGGPGHNTVLMRDHPAHLGLSLHSSTAQTWLQMGHLLDLAQAGAPARPDAQPGFELRTQAHGLVQASAGVLLSTHGVQEGPDEGDAPIQDNTSAWALRRQARQLAQCLSHPPAQPTNVEPSPHAAPLLITGRGPLSIHAQHGLHTHSGGDTELASAQDTHWTADQTIALHAAHTLQVHTGLMAGGADTQGAPLDTLVCEAQQGALRWSAPQGDMEWAAHQDLRADGGHGPVHLQAHTQLVLEVSGGARIVIDGSSLTLDCPGQLRVQASSQVLEGP